MSVVRCIMWTSALNDGGIGVRTVQPVAVEVQVVPSPSALGDDLERWIQGLTALSPERGIMWLPRWSRHGAAPVRSVEHLAVLISSLGQQSFSGVESDSHVVRRWAQTMRVGDDWIVEVRDCSVDDFPMRVFRGEPGEYPPRGDGREELYTIETWTSMGAADVIWSWVQESLPAGCSRTLGHFGPNQRRQYGL